MNHPLVSVIVTTRNNRETLDECLHSISRQSYNPIELIVVDNHSTDETQAIARRHTNLVFTRGPERSAQRNFGVHKASGQYVLIIDSDMELGHDVVMSCVARVQADSKMQAIIIPEESFGRGFWAQCKRLERSFYVGVPAIEAARFFSRSLYQDLGGYNEDLNGPEDWDLSHRACAVTLCGRIDASIRHNEGHLRFLTTMRKKQYYAQTAHAYLAVGPRSRLLTHGAGPLARYKLFFSHPVRLLRNPAVGVGMLVMKACEFGFGGVGYWRGRRATPDALQGLRSLDTPSSALSAERRVPSSTRTEK